MAAGARPIHAVGRGLGGDELVFIRISLNPVDRTNTA